MVEPFNKFSEYSYKEFSTLLQDWPAKIFSRKNCIYVPPERYFEMQDLITEHNYLVKCELMQYLPKNLSIIVGTTGVVSLLVYEDGL